MRIQNNIDAMRGLRYGQKLNNSMTKSLQKLSSGYRINSAADDAAGLAVSEKMRFFMTEYDRCIDNVKEGENLAQTADAALQEVNDMLCRAKELCVRAANGTYSAQERDALQDELEALYSEMDRIFETSRFNTVQLFRHGGEPTVPGHYELIEHAEPMNNLQEWGKMDNIQDRSFSFAEDAKGATVTVPLDSSVDPNDISTVFGKSIFVADSGCMFEFVDSTSNTSMSKTNSNNNTGYPVYRIGVRNCGTLQEALDKMCEYMEENTLSNWDHAVSGDDIYLKDAVVNGNGITLTFKPVDLVQKIPLGASSEEYIVKEADGTKGNDLPIVSREQLDLDQVDGSGETNNPVVYAPGTVTIKLLPGRGDSEVLTDAEKETISGNSIVLYNGNSIKFSTDGSDASAIDLRSITTVGDLRDAIASKIDAITQYVVEPGGRSGESLTIKQSGARGYDYIYEDVASIPGDSRVQATAGLNVSTQRTSTAGGETKDAYTVKLPETLPDYFSVRIGSAKYSFYNGLPSGFDYVYGNGSTTVNTAGKSKQDIYNLIKDRIASAYPRADVTINGEEISIQAKYSGDALGVNVRGEAGSIEFYEYTTTTGTPVLTGTSGTNYFTQRSEVEMDLSVAMGGGAFDASKLDGRGFKLGSKWFEFDDGDNTKPRRRPDATLVDVSACASYDDVRAALNAEMSSMNSSAAKNVTVTNTGSVIKITFDRAADSSSGTTFLDGYKGIDGLLTEEPVDGTAQETFYTSGGTLAGKPSAFIDFSQYDSSNFSELYGKGFRVTCATCAGEYINVMFCNDKGQLNVPESFEIMDQTQTPPVPRVIHNLAVELKGMKSGEDIVKAIVKQLSPELDHYTEVAVGNPASVLNVMDKRRGDIEVDGRVYRAQILSGVRTNFTYTLKEEFIPDPVDGIPVDFSKVKIYAGSEPEPQIIDIHLPYLTLDNLKLTDPEDPDLSTTEAAAATMQRVIDANNVISYARGTIGADFNRLEHAHANLTQSEVQMTDAYSRIRDADMAEEMMEKVRVSILQQAQQTTFMHSVQQPQQIISLLGA